MSMLYEGGTGGGGRERGEKEEKGEGEGRKGEGEGRKGGGERDTPVPSSCISSLLLIMLHVIPSEAFLKSLKL